MQNKDSALRLADAIKTTRLQFDSGPLSPDEITAAVLENLDPPAIRAAAYAWIRVCVDRSLRQELKAAARADERQFLLPGFQRLEKRVRIAGKYFSTADLLLPEYRVYTAECEKRLEGYHYARRSTKAENREKELLRELRKFDPIFARFAAGDSSTTLERAKKLHAASLETPRAKHYQTIASKGGKAKNRRTKNQ